MKNKVKIPFDFAASLKIKGWRKNYRPLVCERKIDKFFNHQDEVLSKYISTLPDNEEKDIFLLALSDLKREVNYYIVAIFALSKAKELGVELVSTVSEVNYLLTGDKSLLDNQTKKDLSERKSSFSLLRRVARTASWTRTLKLIKTLLFPEIIVVGHNSTTVQYAKEINKTVSFYQAAVLLDKISSTPSVEDNNPDCLNKISKNFY